MKKKIFPRIKYKPSDPYSLVEKMQIEVMVRGDPHMIKNIKDPWERLYEIVYEASKMYVLQTFDLPQHIQTFLISKCSDNFYYIKNPSIETQNLLLKTWSFASDLNDYRDNSDYDSNVSSLLNDNANHLKMRSLNRNWKIIGYIKSKDF